MSAPDTLPRLLTRNAGAQGTRPAMRVRRRGIWQVDSWADHHEAVMAIARGLAAAGFGRNDRLLVLGDNRPALYRAALAAMCLGGAAVPCWPDAEPEWLAAAAATTGATIAIAEDDDQVAKLLSVHDRVPDLRLIVHTDPRGVRHEASTLVRPLEAVVADGRDFAVTDVAGPGSVALVLLVTPATGAAEVVALTHANLIAAATALMAAETVRADDEYFAYLPLAWIGEALYGLVLPLLSGHVVSCPEDPETARRDLREIGPTILLLPPRICESLIAEITAKATHATPFKRRLCAAWLPDVLSGATKGQGGLLAEWLVHAPLRDQLGLGRLRWAHTGGLPADPHLLRYFHAIGVPLRHGFGPAHCAGFVSLSAAADTLGPVASGIEADLDVDGELLLRGPSVAVPAGTAWRSGQMAELTPRGLRLLGAIGDRDRLADGQAFHPEVIESALRASHFIADVVALGRGGVSTVALVAIDAEALGGWAQDRGIAYATVVDLFDRPEVTELIRAEVVRAAAVLPAPLRPNRLGLLDIRPGAVNAEAGLSLTLRRRLALADPATAAALLASAPGGRVITLDGASSRTPEAVS